MAALDRFYCTVENIKENDQLLNRLLNCEALLSNSACVLEAMADKLEIERHKAGIPISVYP